MQWIVTLYRLRIHSRFREIRSRLVWKMQFGGLIRFMFSHRQISRRHVLHFSANPAPCVYGAVSQKWQYSSSLNERNWKSNYGRPVGDTNSHDNSSRKCERKAQQKETSAAKNWGLPTYFSEPSLPSLSAKVEEREAVDVDTTGLIPVCGDRYMHGHREPAEVTNWRQQKALQKKAKLL